MDMAAIPAFEQEKEAVIKEVQVWKSPERKHKHIPRWWGSTVLHFIPHVVLGGEVYRMETDGSSASRSGESRAINGSHRGNY